MTQLGPVRSCSESSFLIISKGPASRDRYICKCWLISQLEECREFTDASELQKCFLKENLNQKFANITIQWWRQSFPVLVLCQTTKAIPRREEAPKHLPISCVTLLWDPTLVQFSQVVAQLISDCRPCVQIIQVNT